MRLLLDQGLPRSTAALLREKGHEVVHVGELGMSDASDEAIITHAHKNAFYIVTLDADFHSLLAVAKASAPSVIRLRLQRLKAEAAAEVISTVLDRVGKELSAGCFVTVTATTVRIRRLPYDFPRELVHVE